MTPKIESLTDLLALLRLALSNRAERASAINAFQNYVFLTRGPISGATDEQLETLDELACDLEYYEPDPVLRRDSYSYYGDERVEVEITEGPQRLGEVAPPSTGHTSGF